MVTRLCRTYLSQILAAEMKRSQHERTYRRTPTWSIATRTLGGQHVPMYVHLTIWTESRTHTWYSYTAPGWSTCTHTITSPHNMDRQTDGRTPTWYSYTAPGWSTCTHVRTPHNMDRQTDGHLPGV